jgi:hypothetical protein
MRLRAGDLHWDNPADGKRHRLYIPEYSDTDLWTLAQDIVQDAIVLSLKAIQTSSEAIRDGNMFFRSQVLYAARAVIRKELKKQRDAQSIGQRPVAAFVDPETRRSTAAVDLAVDQRRWPDLLLSRITLAKLLKLLDAFCSMKARRKGEARARAFRETVHRRWTHYYLTSKMLSWRKLAAMPGGLDKGTAQRWYRAFEKYAGIRERKDD